MIIYKKSPFFKIVNEHENVHEYYVKKEKNMHNELNFVKGNYIDAFNSRKKAARNHTRMLNEPHYVLIYTFLYFLIYDD